MKVDPVSITILIDKTIVVSISIGKGCVTPLKRSCPIWGTVYVPLPSVPVAGVPPEQDSSSSTDDRRTAVERWSEEDEMGIQCAQSFSDRQNLSMANSLGNRWTWMYWISFLYWKVTCAIVRRINRTPINISNLTCWKDIWLFSIRKIYIFKIVNPYIMIICM